MVDNEPLRASCGFVKTAICAYPQDNKKIGMALAENVADFGRVGWWPPAARVADTPRGAGISGKKKGPEIIRALEGQRR